MRVAIIYPAPAPAPAPLAPANLSGTPDGLASGFAACAVDVVPIGIRVSHGLVAALFRSTGRRRAAAGTAPRATYDDGTSLFPVIATSRGGAGGLIKDNATVVVPGESTALVQAMLVAADPSAAQSMGSAAARNAATSSWTDVADRILDVLGPDNKPANSGRTGESTDV